MDKEDNSATFRVFEYESLFRGVCHHRREIFTKKVRSHVLKIPIPFYELRKKFAMKNAEQIARAIY